LKIDNIFEDITKCTREAFDYSLSANSILLLRSEHVLTEL